MNVERWMMTVFVLVALIVACATAALVSAAAASVSVATAVCCDGTLSLVVVIQRMQESIFKVLRLRVCVVLACVKLGFCICACSMLLCAGAGGWM